MLFRLLFLLLSLLILTMIRNAGSQGFYRPTDILGLSTEKNAELDDTISGVNANTPLPSNNTNDTEVDPKDTDTINNFVCPYDNIRSGTGCQDNLKRWVTRLCGIFKDKSPNGPLQPCLGLLANASLEDSMYMNCVAITCRCKREQSLPGLCMVLSQFQKACLFYDPIANPNWYQVANCDPNLAPFGPDITLPVYTVPPPTTTTTVPPLPPHKDILILSYNIAAAYFAVPGVIDQQSNSAYQQLISSAFSNIMYALNFGLTCFRATITGILAANQEPGALYPTYKELILNVNCTINYSDNCNSTACTENVKTAITNATQDQSLSLNEQLLVDGFLCRDLLLDQATANILTIVV